MTLDVLNKQIREAAAAAKQVETTARQLAMGDRKLNAEELTVAREAMMAARTPLATADSYLWSFWRESPESKFAVAREAKAAS